MTAKKQPASERPANDDQTTPDPVAEALEASRAAEDLAVAELRQLRAEHEQLRADQAGPLAASEGRLAAAEAAAGHLEAERRHAEQLAEATDSYKAAEGAYSDARTAADAAVAEVDRLTVALAEAFKAAAELEVTRIAAGRQLRGTWQRLHQLDETVDEPQIATARLHARNPNSPLMGAQHIAVTMHPQVEGLLHQLAGRRSNNYKSHPMPRVTIGG